MTELKWLVYNAIFALVFPFLLPGFLARMCRRGGYGARMGDRFALYPSAVRSRLLGARIVRRGTKADAHGDTWDYGEFVWIHAVSVGEVQVAGQLMRVWREAEPTVRFCFSTTSSTGWQMAKREISGRDELVYNPLDFPNFVKSALKTIRPRAIVLTESEIWPVFIMSAKRRDIPLFLINARVSDRSAPRYRLARAWFGDVFGAFTRIFAQSELDRSRLLAAGAPAERTEVTGSFKFDVARRNREKEAELARWLDGCGDILLGGSTWPGEDAILLDAYRDLIGSLKAGERRVTLVIAPRHFEKADDVEANVVSAGFECIRRSRGDSAAGGDKSKVPVYLADTTGELMGLYALASVVFVGKSISAHGSQNMIEPCLCGKPTIVGPYTENFRPVMSDLLEGGGIVQVSSAADLKREIARLFADRQSAAALGERAAAAVSRRTGVVPRCVGEIRSLLRQ